MDITEPLYGIYIYKSTAYKKAVLIDDFPSIFPARVISNLFPGLYSSTKVTKEKPIRGCKVSHVRCGN